MVIDVCSFMMFLMRKKNLFLCMNFEFYFQGCELFLVFFESFLESENEGLVILVYKFSILLSDD